MAAEWHDDRERVLTELSEIRSALSSMATKLSVLSIDHGHRIDCLERDVKVLETKVQAVEKSVEKLVPVLRFLAFVGSSLVALIIALLWALLTGQAQLIFH